MSCINFRKTSLAASDSKFAPWLGNSRIISFPKVEKLWPDECRGVGFLAATSGIQITWSRQLTKLVEWDWVQIFFQKKYGGGCRHERTMSFCSVLSFPASKHQEKVFMNFFNGSLWHQEAWCMNSSWVTSLYIVIRHLGKFSFNTPVLHRTWIFERPACSISYLFPLTVVLRLSSKIYATSTLC